MRKLNYCFLKFHTNFEIIADDCKYDEEYGDYESMEEELGMTQLRCVELKKKIDEALLFGYR